MLAQSLWHYIQLVCLSVCVCICVYVDRHVLGHWKLRVDSETAMSTHSDRVHVSKFDSWPRVCVCARRYLQSERLSEYINQDSYITATPHPHPWPLRATCCTLMRRLARTTSCYLLPCFFLLVTVRQEEGNWATSVQPPSPSGLSLCAKFLNSCYLCLTFSFTSMWVLAYI